jgi:hypothetical protein
MKMIQRKLRIKLVFLTCILMIAIILFTGCEKIINVDLVEAKPQLVIEGLITDGTGPYTVKLSKTGSYFNKGVLPLVSKAVVVISDNRGAVDTLKESKPGIYLTSKIRGIPGRTYSLMVLSDKIKYTASSTMFSHVNIDLLKLEKSYSSGTGLGDIGQAEIRVEIICYFQDPLEKNYYRTVVLNDSQADGNFKLYDDEYTNGKKTGLQVKRAKIGDKINVELMSLDKSTFEYYRTLSDLLNSNPIFGSTPVNPNTNLTNGALGFFGAFAISTKTINITESLYNNAK